LRFMTFIVEGAHDAVVQERPGGLALALVHSL
jgi:hypothetical protein